MTGNSGLLAPGLALFTDGSVNARTKVGYGAYLVVSEPRLPLDDLRVRVKLRRFEQTSSTRLELQTMLWALNEAVAVDSKVLIYTDSQNIVGLPERRERLEKNDYYARNKARLKNHELYREFYRLTDQLQYSLIKVRGHQAAGCKDDIDKLFSLVDKASRSALRDEGALL